MPSLTKKLVVFDLDGTLAASKSEVSPEMSKAIIGLTSLTKVAIISGGGYPQFQKQFLASLPYEPSHFSNLFLLPTSGTRLYTWRGSWNEQYAEHLSPREKEKIMIALNGALTQAHYVKPEKLYGQIIEDRGSQITFSALGQQAPGPEKAAWDPTRKKRTEIASFLQPKLPEFDVRIGGSTSIDITKKGVNKAFGIRKLEEYLKISPDDIVFVGDALFPGGNDYPARATGVDCIQVSGPDETLKLINGWISS